MPYCADASTFQTTASRASGRNARTATAACPFTETVCMPSTEKGSG